MKREYQSPTLNTQNFVPNESVAACYTLVHTSDNWLVECPSHLGPSWDDYPHAGRNQKWTKTTEELIAAGVPEAQLRYVGSTPASTDIGSHILKNIDLGGDGVMTHTNVLIQWRDQVLTEQEVPADGVNTVS